jgi:hypothetical protein
LFCVIATACVIASSEVVEDRIDANKFDIQGSS